MLRPSDVLFLKAYAKYLVMAMPRRNIMRPKENLPTVTGYSPTCQSSVSLILEKLLPQKKFILSSLSCVPVMRSDSFRRSMYWLLIIPRSTRYERYLFFLTARLSRNLSLFKASPSVISGLSPLNLLLTACSVSLIVWIASTQRVIFAFMSSM